MTVVQEAIAAKKKPRARAAKQVARGKAKRESALPCTQFWSGTFGDEYTDRNKVEWRDRIPLLSRILETAPATSFLDVGCNAGWNMLALREIVGADKIAISGLDVNQKALEQAGAAGLDVILAPATACCDEPLSPTCAEMVITSGVLIHVPPEDLNPTLTAIREASMQYVLAIEYPSLSGAEEPVEYRGHEGRLWRRDYGAEYVKLGGLALIESGVAEGYDGCNYWLLERVA